jgi:hypothetical protein
MKKSNNLGGLTGPPKRHGPHWVGLKHSAGTEYARIRAKACRLAQFQGRRIAIEYLQRQRPWLEDYLRPLPLGASGTVLDQWLESSPWKRKL